ncbi:TVP38/TMEM64 family protein [Peptoniphilaceae bacterium SGI.131]
MSEKTDKEIKEFNIDFDDAEEAEIAKRRKIFNRVASVGLIIGSVFAIYGFTKGYFTDPSKFKDLLGYLGPASPFIFVILQALLIVFPVIPAGINYLAGILAYGNITGFLLNYIGICLGSLVIFLLARFYGRAFVGIFAKEKTYNKYVGWLNKGGKIDYMLIGALLIPFAPDDITCMLCGLTDMKTSRFLTILLLLKPISLVSFLFIMSKGADSLYKLIFG